jgi:hypothetical protein
MVLFDSDEKLRKHEVMFREGSDGKYSAEGSGLLR